MTRGEIRDAVLQNLRESANPVRWTTDELNEYIDDGYVEMAERTGAVMATQTIATTANNHFATLPTNCLYPIAARDVTTGQPIDPVHWRFLDAVDRVWIRRASTYPTLFAMFGLREIILYPAYQAPGTIEMIMAVVPTGFTADNEEPDLPDEYHYGLIHYATGRCLLKDAHGQEAGPRLGRAQRQFRYWQETMGTLTNWTFDRHADIFKAIYGERYRSAEIGQFGVILN